MNVTPTQTTISSDLAGNSSLFDSGTRADDDLHWFALQTQANHERKVSDELVRREFEVYFPRFTSIRRWKDRRVKLLMSLFPGYVFVHFSLRDRLRVLQVPSVVRLVGFGGKPAPLLCSEIESLRFGTAHDIHMEPHSYIKVGQRVRVRSGPLLGLQGVLLRKKNVSRLIVSLDLIMRSVAVEVDVTELEPAF